MACNVTISIPENLKREIDSFRAYIQISAVCTAALARRVEEIRAEQQRVRDLESEVARLRAERSRGETL